MPRTFPFAPAAVFFALAHVAAAPQTPYPVTPALGEVLGRITEDGLRGNLSFLASDLLEGRNTPSRGLDIAAEYIAAQFRKSRLEPAGEGYFQNAPFVISEPRTGSFELELESGGRTTKIKDGVTVQSAAALAIERAPALAVMTDAALPSAADAAGKVLFADWPRNGGMRRVEALRELEPALLIVLDPDRSVPWRNEKTSLVDPEERAATAPWISVSDRELVNAVHAGMRGATVSVRLDAPAETPVKLRNVIGVLRGSDPALRNTCVLVTAHYDHVGTRSNCETGDCVYNGANDNGSGTVSLIEMAAALASSKERPRRSIVFLAVFGEEEGGYGARYYARHPVFPLMKTVANVNLEQLGRTDAEDGPQVGTATFTGYDFSDLPRFFASAGKATGVKVYNTKSSNRYFTRSDNLTFAKLGIPAHTVCVAYVYPDYHGLGDSWEKIDYANMARVDRMLALGVFMIADSPVPPRWNEANRHTATYVEAWKRLTRQAPARVD